MTRLNLQLAKKNEKGIALLFTLIMLSLLLMLAMSFALDSMFEQKAAYNSASSSSSGLMGQAQLKQVLLLMKEGQATFDANGMLYSHTTTTPAITDTDMLKDKLPYGDVLVFDFANPNDSNLSDQAVKEVQWTYVKNAEGKIVGRTAFIVVPEDKIPLDSLVDDRAVSATLSASCPYPKHDEKDDTETRIGKYVSEINVRGAIPAVTTNISTISEKLNRKGDTTDSNLGFTNGLYTGIWTSFNKLFSTVGVTPAADKTEFESKLTLTTVKDEEAFWVDLDGDKKIGSTEIYNRFDLTRADWSTSTTNADDLTFIKNVILLDSDGDGVPDIKMNEWDGNDSLDDFSVPATLANYSKGLPWLATFGYKTDGTVDAALNGTFPNVAARRYQIAANLKDYSDTDSRPTSDVDPSTWSTLPSPVGYVHPTYTGNEKTPYINKVGMRFKVAQYEVDDTGSYTVGASVLLSPSIELINIYDSGCSQDLSVAIEGTVTIKTTIAGSTAFTAPAKSFSCTMNILSGQWTNVGYSDFIMANSILPFKTGEKSGITGSRQIDLEVIQINFTKVALVNISDGYDYTKNLLQNYATPVTAYLNAGGVSQYMWYGFAANDPRQNLFYADWKPLTPLLTNNASLVFSFTNSSETYTGAPNADNTNNGGGDNTEAPSTGPDLEIGLDPANRNLSTAHIRNAPMESPWELGFIHRGAKWETLNLKVYDKSKGFQITTAQINSQDYIPGGGAYASGDANILDQVKMTAKAESPQKINMSSQEDATFNALFYKVKLGCDADSAITLKSMAGLDTTTTGKAIVLTSSEYTTMRTAIKAKFASPDVSTYTNLTRASIANATNILLSADNTEPSPAISLSAGLTDAAQEELIGKIINLTKVGAQSGDFAIIVLSQTINDIGGAIGSPEITVYKVPADGSAALPVDCQIGDFDVAPGSDTDTWKDDAYGDEITGEQKIMIKGNNSVNGIITIKSFQYID